MSCAAAAVLGLIAAAVPVSAAPVSAMCDVADPFAFADDVGGIASPCAVAPGSLQLEALYLQNASAIGQTALAAYPLLRLRTGIAPRLELAVDAPAQIAESGPEGRGGLFPRTHLGYGVDYALVQSAGSALALVTEYLPPTSRFAPMLQTQPKYLIGLTSDRRLGPRFVLGLSGSGTSSSSVGFERFLPAFDARIAYRATPFTQVVSAVGTHLIGPHAVGQSFADLSVNERLHGNTLFNVGIGTTFNAVSNTKAHYLASGFDYRL